MPTTMQLISAQTLTSATGSVTFSSIPQTFTDLVVKISCRVDNTNGYPNLRFNNSATNYSGRYIYGSGSAVSSSTGNTTYIELLGAEGPTQTSNTFTNQEFYVPNYTSSNYKSVSIDTVSENNATFAETALWGYLWSDTSAITSILLRPTGATNFVAGSSFYLYGISSNTTTQNSDGPYAFGGDSIVLSGGYWYHAFLNSNSFTPQKALTADVMVVAGGAGGGNGTGGGGGAGGFRLLTAQSLTSNTPYICAIGAGSSGGISTNGSNSTFGSISASGGGYGGNGGNNGNNGGSGGGGGYLNTSLGGSGNTGSYSPVEGYAGGNGGSGANFPSGGGGGAGGAGSFGSGNKSGNGGVGAGGTSYTNYTIINAMASATNTGQLSSGNYYFAGGGGGGNDNRSNNNQGTGGLGGGADGGPNSSDQNGRNATANTGGGGGGGANSGNGGNGGSGIIIVRYPV